MNTKDLNVGDIVYYFNNDNYKIEKYLVKFVVDRNYCIVARIKDDKNIHGEDNTLANVSRCTAFLEKSELDCLIEQLGSCERSIRSIEDNLERRRKDKAKVERMIRVLKKKLEKEQK